MKYQKQLLEEIEQALTENDKESLKILLEDEDQAFINELQCSVKDENNRNRLAQFLEHWKEQAKNKKEDIENLDRIRKINANVHKQQQGQQNLIQKQIKCRKQLKLEQKFGYSFYGNIKCLLIAYGDLKPNEESIKMMHSQIEVLFEIILKSIQKSENSLKETEANVRRCIESIFREQSKAYYEITKQYKKAAKSATNRQQKSCSSSQCEDFPPDEDSAEQIDHMSVNTIEESQYFAKITNKMNTKQYQNYSQCRSVNFMQRSNNKKNIQSVNKFIKFLDENIGVLKPNMKIYDLLSFICCRFIRKIVFEVVRQKKEGKLQPGSEPITSDEIRKIGNTIIQNYQKKLKQIKVAQQSIIDIAKRTFIKDLQENNFKSLLPQKYFQSNKSAQEIWQECRVYREKWVERVSAEKQIQNEISSLENDETDPKTQYTKFILKYLDYYKSKGSTFLWKKYFVHEKVEDSPTENKINVQGQPKKKVKLQSLKN